MKKRLLLSIVGVIGFLTMGSVGASSLKLECPGNMKIGFRTCQLVLDSDSTEVEKISIDYQLSNEIKINNLNSNESAGWKLVAPTSTTNSGTWTYENSSKTIGKTILGEVELATSMAGSYTFEIKDAVYTHKNSVVGGTSDNNLIRSQILVFADYAAIENSSNPDLSLKYLEIDGMEFGSLNGIATISTKKDFVKIRAMAKEGVTVSIVPTDGPFMLGGVSHIADGTLSLKEGKNEFSIYVWKKDGSGESKSYQLIMDKKSETTTTVDTNKTTTKNNNQIKTSTNTVVKNPATGDDFIKYGAAIVLLMTTIIIIKKKITKLN